MKVKMTWAQAEQIHCAAMVLHKGVWASKKSMENGKNFLWPKSDLAIFLFLNLWHFSDLKAFFWGPCAQCAVGFPYRHFQGCFCPLKICLLGTRTEEKYIYFWERIFFTETTAPEDLPTFLGPPVALNLRGLNFLATPLGYSTTLLIINRGFISSHYHWMFS